jgi:hypothetical protein
VLDCADENSHGEAVKDSLSLPARGQVEGIIGNRIGKHLADAVGIAGLEK